MSGSRYPDYVRGLVDWPMLNAPFAAYQVQTAVFVFAAKFAQIQATLDRYLNAVCAPAYTYEALLPCVTMTLVDIPVGNSLNPTDEAYGLVPERDLSFWIPALASQWADGKRVRSWVTSFAPYLFVDTAVATTIGREEYGFRKQSGSMTRPADFANPEFSATTLAIKTLSPKSIARVEPLLQVDRVRSPERPPVRFNSLDEARQVVAATLAKRGSAQPWIDSESLERMLLAPGLDVSFLKQFPDIADTTKACYQAVTEATIAPKNFRDGGLLGGEFQLTLNDLGTQPIAQELGLELDGAGRQMVDFGFWVASDFVQETGREVYVKTAAV